MIKPRTVPLRDVLWISTERLEPSEFADREFNYIGLEDLESHTGRLAVHGATRGGEILSAKNIFHPGQILYGKLRPYLNKVHLAEAEGVCSTDILVLSCDPARLMPSFAAYYLRSKFILNAVENLTIGASLPRIDPKAFLSLTIPLLPLSEQKRLVELLDEAETLRRLRAEADGRMRAVDQALFAERFGDPVCNERLWPIVRVARFVDRFEAGRSVAASGDEDTSSKHRILKVSAVTSGRFVVEESKPVSDSYIPRPEHFVRVGDMLFSRANTTELIGATVLVENSPGNLLLPDKLWRFVWKSPVTIEPRFVLAMFQNRSIRAELARRATGTGGSMKNIAMGRVLSMEVPLPPLSRQRSFAAQVAEIRAFQAIQASSQRRLDDLFESLVQSAFEGEL